MTKKQYQRYSPEFKIHALKRASEVGVTDKAVCEELGMSRRQLRVEVRYACIARRRNQYRLRREA
jgi:transposase-like protein